MASWTHKETHTNSIIYTIRTTNKVTELVTSSHDHSDRVMEKVNHHGELE
jgi:hypothetical protein